MAEYPTGLKSGSRDLLNKHMQMVDVKIEQDSQIIFQQ